MTVCHELSPQLLHANQYNLFTIDVLMSRLYNSTLLIADLDKAVAVDFLNKDQVICWMYTARPSALFLTACNSISADFVAPAG